MLKLFGPGRLAVTLSAAFASAFLGAHRPVHADPSLEVLASYPGPTFLENLEVADDGAIYVTNYSGKGIERIRPGQKAERFVELDAHPVSILVMPSGFLLAVHGKSFTEGPAFIGSGRLLTLDPQGKLIAELPVPDAGMLNGMMRLENGQVLLADSVKGQILRYDPAQRQIGVWLTDARLVPQTAPHFVPGANGLKRRGGTLLISSSAQRKVFSVEVGADGAAAGPMEPVLELPGADDFAVLPDGGLIVATHGKEVLRVSPAGAVSTLTSDPRVLGNTAVAITGSGASRKVVILGTGGFSEGGKADAAIVAISLPE